MDSISAYTSSRPTIALEIVGILLAYLVGLAVWRLYLSPLAKFPGPKLAGLTLWYEFYYDVVKRGKYTWEIEKMHAQYGKHGDMERSLPADDICQAPSSASTRMNFTSLILSTMMSSLSAKRFAGHTNGIGK